MTFTNKNAKWHWGVGQISLSTGPKIDETLTVGGNTSGNYGNHWGNLKDHDGIIKFDFDVSDLSKDLHLTLNAYDMDFSDEMKLVLNGKTIDHLDKTGNNGTTAQAFILSSSDLVTGLNELTFTNKNAKWHWGVGQISLLLVQKLMKPLRSVETQVATTAITGATSKTMMELSNLTSMSLIYLRTST